MKRAFIAVRNINDDETNSSGGTDFALPADIPAQQPDRVNITSAPLDGMRGKANMSADSIVRGAAYPSIVHLKGAVEIRTAGYILHADEADFNEGNAEVEAHGSVKVTPYPALHPE